jgi:hypothetical protein
MLPVCGQADKLHRSFEAMMRNNLIGLRTTYSLTLAKKISVTISGPDEDRAAKLLANKYGELHVAQPGETIRAWVTMINKEGVTLEAGHKFVLVPCLRLKPLGRGEAQRVASRFGLI